MCNFSQGFYERGFEEGFREGLKEGYRQSAVSSLKAVMESLDIDFIKAADLLEIPEAERENFRELVEDFESDSQ